MSTLDPTGIAARIRRVLIDSLSLDLRDEEVAYAERLDEVVGLDSLTVLEFVAALEKEFAIVLDPEHLELEKLKDLAALTSYIRAQVER